MKGTRALQSLIKDTFAESDNSKLETDERRSFFKMYSLSMRRNRTEKDDMGR